MKHYPTIKQARFWMTFSERYLTVLEVLQGLGLTSIKPINYQGMEIVPLQFIKAILPDPAALGENYKGKYLSEYNSKVFIKGKERSYYIWSNLDHEKAYKETGTQAVAYSTGVPAMVGALMYMKIYGENRAYITLNNSTRILLEAMPKYGIDWQEAIDIPLPIDKAEQQ